MGSVDLLRRLRTPGSTERTSTEQPLRPWDNQGLRRVTTQIQIALRRDCPALLAPADLGAAVHTELLMRIRGYLSGDSSLRLPDVPVDILAQQVFDYVAGLGPIGALLERPQISEIMVNRHDDVWIETDGRLTRLLGVSFRDDTHVFYVAQRVLAPLGIELSAAHPLAEGRLPGNIRVAASMPPIGPHTTLSIRKPAIDRLSTEEYLKRDTATSEMLDLLQAAVRGRANLLIAGPTGTGKSTLLRYLSSYFDPGARIVVLEQLAELGLERYHPHVIALEARSQSGSTRAGQSMADLLHHALHRRPDYIVVGDQ